MAAITQLLWIIQIALVIHVYRTGRPYWWTFILFSAPVIGGIAYLLVEVAPNLRRPDGHGFLYSLKPRKWRIAELRGVLEESDTVKNRLALAAELAAGDQPQEAHDVAAECLQGVFRDDPRTLYDVAHYKANIGRHQEALGLLARVKTEADRRLAVEVALLQGDCLSGTGRLGEAETYYRSIEGLYTGEAPRAGLAGIMERTGRIEEAKAIWQDIRKKYRRASPAWRRTEMRWYKLASAKLSAAKG